ncbi:trigger factor [Salinibacter sp. 10B]|uniref:trigger factor n=1 Tax=Salinibacter sp. 10B TaxID=1923971 RepID=UPI000CF55D5C|nr:trigger factor [Salinibacter sp. 10B]PQJ34666.1 trigger factor [Salinibacter sp. 10B]
METTLSKASPVEYELDLHATADDIEPKLKEALKEQRKHMDVQGFRQGKVPLGLVKKMHGEQIGYKVAQEFVQEAFEDEVEGNDDIEPLGQPTITELNYELDQDLHAVVRFGVRPEVDLQDVSSEQISMLEHEVTEEDVEEEIERLRTKEADLLPMEDEPAGEEDFVNIDLQRIDPQTDTPIIGDKDEDLSFFLDDERLKEELREALKGKKAGDTFRVELPQDPHDHDHGPGGHDHDHDEEERLYEVTVNDVKQRDLPPFDEAFVERLTEQEFSDPEAFRDEVRRQLEEQWDEQAREMVQGEIVDKMLELHPVPVPESVIETYLDSFVNQVEQENDGELPDDFDEEHFRNRNRRDAEKQGRWMLIRDKIIEEEDLEVTDEELQEFFADQAQGDEVSAQQIEQFYRQMPKMMDRVKQQVLSDKVYDLLIDRFDVQKKSREEFEEEMHQQHQGQQRMTS